MTGTLAVVLIGLGLVIGIYIGRAWEVVSRGQYEAKRAWKNRKAHRS